MIHVSTQIYDSCIHTNLWFMYYYNSMISVLIQIYMIQESTHIYDSCIHANSLFIYLFTSKVCLYDASMQNTFA